MLPERLIHNLNLMHPGIVVLEWGYLGRDLVNLVEEPAIFVNANSQLF